MHQSQEKSYGTLMGKIYHWWYCIQVHTASIKKLIDIVFLLHAKKIEIYCGSGILGKVVSNPVYNMTSQLC